jgi:ubiquinone/menaquinone biosynthesis C-methylase UbiE
MAYKFDYESKVWGGGEVTTSPFCLTAPKLIFALEVLKSLPAGKRVLEVGCGAGGISKAIKKYRPDLKVVGVDISKTQLNLAKKNPGGVAFKFGSAYKLPFKASTFDAVVMFDVLEHLDDPKKCLLEIKRVLKPYGIYSLFTPIEGNLLSIHGLANKVFGFIPKEKYGGHIQNFTYKDVHLLLTSTGFKPVKSSYYGHLFNQIIDFSYFTWLSIRGKNTQGSVESYIGTHRGPMVKLLEWIKNIISLVSFIESKLLFFLSASGVSIFSTVNGKAKSTT